MGRDSFQSIYSTQDKLLHTYGYPTYPLDKRKKMNVEINLFITNPCTPNNLLTQYSIWVYKTINLLIEKVEGIWRLYVFHFVS